MMMSDLPKDLVEEILSRLPATTLKRLRSTCKLWNSLFKDEGFARKHFDKAARQDLVVMLKDSRAHSVNVNLRGIHNNNFDPYIKDIGELSLNQVDINKMVHCNGLLFCITKDNIPMVWNPCTGETKWVEPRRVYDKSDRFAFGYEYKKSCYNYKILRIQDAHGIEIYEFNSNSWKILDVTCDWCIRTHAVSLEGNAYWFASEYKKGTEHNTCLVSFDFSKEIFEAMDVPFQFMNGSDIVALSVTRENKLAVLMQRWALEMEIWVRDKIEPNAVSWNQFVEVDMGLKLPAGTDNMFSFKTTFSIDEDYKVALVWHTDHDKGAESRKWIEDIKIFIIGEDIYREIVIGKIDYRYSYPLMYNYVPSLVQI
ncbi:F-box domain [Arabidopsis thaliana x Arabidopsis arenosa]|uniref:F-box domain n=1 Tax=Arabidopsis thaliana x Arabidopsis arenosa TaxID=1240361 RepID=A0A8T2AX63_9BRAS|nr:F-box domain [Arabidopsis thaliana x Arabidopsis arenosa]